MENISRYEKKKKNEKSRNSKKKRREKLTTKDQGTFERNARGAA